MANMNCSACEDLRTVDPTFSAEGLTEEKCESLANNTGLIATSGSDDCTDLNNMNDCLVGGMSKDISSYSSCDWKTYTKRFVANIHTVFKGVISAVCGLWSEIDRLNCVINYLMEGDSFEFSETSDTTSYIVAGLGVSFANVGESGTSSNISVTYVAGGLAVIGGTVRLYTSPFTEDNPSYSFDNDESEPEKTSGSRLGNSIWNDQDTKPGGYSTELLYEIRILKSEFPNVTRFFSGVGLNLGGGGFHVEFQRSGEGTYASGLHGACDALDGTPATAGDSAGHLVPEGWEYIQCRVTWIEELVERENGAVVSPRGYIGVRMNPSSIEC